MRRKLIQIFEVTLVILALILILGQLLNQPILLAFVETGSMEPTLSPGDGYIAVPAAIAGPVEEGDVVVYRPQKLERERVTHRVIEETPTGYVTKGDANPFTDQDSGEGLVRRPQIEAEALQFNGEVLVLPQLGTAAQAVKDVLFVVQSNLATLFRTGLFVGLEGLTYLFFLFTLVVYGIGYWRDTFTRRLSRQTSRDTGSGVHLILLAFTGLIVVAATAAMALPAGTQQYGVVSSEVDAPQSNVIVPGGSESTELMVSNAGVLPVAVFFEDLDEGIDVHPDRLQLDPGGRRTASVTLSVPEKTGYYRRYLVEHRYLALLPQPVLRSLYDVHPWAPVVAIDALVGVPFYLLGLFLVGTGRLRERSRSRALSYVTLVRRLLTLSRR